jgi:hypothetical protein
LNFDSERLVLIVEIYQLEYTAIRSMGKLPVDLKPLFQYEAFWELFTLF